MVEIKPSAQRLDQHVVELQPKLSRSFAVKLIEKGQVSVNGAPQLKPSYRLKASDKVVIDFDAPTEDQIPAVDIPIIYEDRSCVVINKPAGLLTHSKGAFNPEATVATWLSERLPPNMTGDRAGIVHRLDRATSGVMICAKTPEALSWLQKQFSQRKAYKTYVAVVAGEPKPPEAVIDMPIERNPRRPQTFRTGSNGKVATTAYRILQSGQKFSLLELKPTTGRTHQLRVHLTKIGHPIVGDTLYGGPAGERLFLHAERLELTLPNKQRKTFEAPVPGSFAEQLHE